MSHDETSATTGLPSFVTSATWRMKNVRIKNRYENDGYTFHNHDRKINNLTGRIFWTCE